MNLKLSIRQRETITRFKRKKNPQIPDQGLIPSFSTQRNPGQCYFNTTQKNQVRAQRDLQVTISCSYQKQRNVRPWVTQVQGAPCTWAGGRGPIPLWPSPGTFASAGLPISQALRGPCDCPERLLSYSWLFRQPSRTVTSLSSRGLRTPQG